MRDEEIFCCSELINEYDTDGSGQIEFPEFCNMMSGRINTEALNQQNYQAHQSFLYPAKMGGDNDEEMVRLAFRTLDKDGSGTIDTGEFKHLMTHIGDKLTEDEVMTIINAADKDGDGTLSYDEFVKIMMG